MYQAGEIKRFLRAFTRLRPTKLAKVKKNLQKITFKEENTQKCVIFFLFETAHYNSLHLLYLAHVMAAQGYTVKVVICDGSMPNCEIKTVKNKGYNPCGSCKFNYHKLFNLSPNLELIPLKFCPSSVTSGGIDKTDIANARSSAVRYYYGDESKALSDDCLLNSLSVVDKFITAMAAEIDLTHSPDIVVSNMDDYVYFQGLTKYFKARGKFRQITMTEFDHSKFTLNEFSLYPAKERFNNFCLSHNFLTDFERSEIRHFMNRRMGLKQDAMRRYGWSLVGIEKLRQALRIDEKKRNVFLFPNLHWDPGVASQNNLFSDVIEWVGETVELCSKIDGLQLFIRPHPEERLRKDGLKYGLIDAMKARGYGLSHNVTIINHEMNVSSYELFPLVDLGVISGGTLGLEMLYQEVPCVSVGTAPYSKSVIDIGVTSKQQYISVLSGEQLPVAPDRADVEKFLYFYFLDCRLAWPLTQKFYGDTSFSVKNLNDSELMALEKIAKTLLRLR